MNAITVLFFCFNPYFASAFATRNFTSRRLVTGSQIFSTVLPNEQRGYWDLEGVDADAVDESIAERRSEETNASTAHQNATQDWFVQAACVVVLALGMMVANNDMFDKKIPELSISAASTTTTAKPTRTPAQVEMDRNDMQLRQQQQRMLDEQQAIEDTMWTTTIDASAGFFFY